MSRRRAPRIVTIPCRRCARPLASLAAPIHTDEATRAKWAGLCDRCITPAERIELQVDSWEAAARRLGIPLVRDVLARMTPDEARAWLRTPSEEVPR